MRRKALIPGLLGVTYNVKHLLNFPENRSLLLEECDPRRMAKLLEYNKGIRDRLRRDTDNANPTDNVSFSFVGNY